MSDRSKRDTQAQDSRVGLTGAVLLLSFAASAALDSAVPAGLGLSFALLQALQAHRVTPAPVPARAGRNRR